jgi:cell division protein FtsX
MGLFLTVLSILLLGWNLLGINRELVLYAVFKEQPEPSLPNKLENLINPRMEIAGPIRLKSCKSLTDPELPEEVRRSLTPNQKTCVSFFLISVKTPQDIPTLEEYLILFDSYFQVVNPERGSLRQALSDSALARTGGIALLLLSFACTLVASAFAFRTLKREWAPELETLYLSGIPMNALRIPFLLTGILHGLFATGLSLFFFYLLHLASLSPDSVFRSWMPDLAQSDLIALLVWRLLILGILLGTLMGSLSLFTVRLRPT